MKYNVRITTHARVTSQWDMHSFTKQNGTMYKDISSVLKLVVEQRGSIVFCAYGKDTKKRYSRVIRYTSLTQLFRKDGTLNSSLCRKINEVLAKQGKFTIKCLY